MVENAAWRTRIKICGMTNLAEALALVPLGVDALGFIFARESPRYIEPEQAREIIRQLPPFVNTVGVFVNEDPDLLNDIVQYCGLTLVQLHGSEPPEYCQSIAATVIKALRVHDRKSLAVWEHYRGVVKGVLLDTWHPDKVGGTGEHFDWQLAAEADFAASCILAGGLDAANVEEAIRRVRPFAVDVNSGVEVEPGRKDIAKAKEFIAAVSRADGQRHDY
ncbi:MAG: phosphoribosylanthranilate isomerase [Deltaproteobacteria bacterium]|nr:phosphoribosylanthranilate isomerase [Deltaproteobacteria bacterium]